MTLTKFASISSALLVFSPMLSDIFQEPTAGQRALFKEAIDALKIEKEVRLVSINPKSGYTTSFADKDFIALCPEQDKNAQLLTIFHELGHIVHDDVVHARQLDRDEKTVDDFLNDPTFANDLATIQRLTELGKTVLDKTSKLGKRIAEVLTQTTSFWQAPEDSWFRRIMEYERGIEQRADLFSYRQLIKKNNTNALLDQIYKRAFSPTIVTESTNAHASDFERALYTLGFLADQGIDINSLVKKWEKTGTCEPLPQPSLHELLKRE